MTERISPYTPELNVQRLKFPRIAHLFTESGRTPDDLLLAENQRAQFLEAFNSGNGVATEKVDGSNIGISFDHNGALQLRHRGGFCHPETPIYRQAFQWADSKRQILYDLLKCDAILFVEWLEFDRGNVTYDKLASYAMAISMFDGSDGPDGRFMSHAYITELLQDTGIPVVPKIDITKPIQTSNDLIAALSVSQLSSKDTAEGMVLRIDDGDYNLAIMKFVDPKFRQSVDESEHWMKKPLVRNIIDWQAAAILSEGQ